jgi:hypothetical protein
VKHKAVLVAVATLMAGFLTACGGGGDTGAYCDSVEDAKADFEKLESGESLDGLEQALNTMHDLADEAPDDVKEDWQVLDGAINDLETALDDAGLKFSDLEAMTSGEIPEDLDPTKIAALGEQLQGLTDEKFQEASENIEKHAKDECDIDLGTS